MAELLLYYLSYIVSGYPFYINTLHLMQCLNATEKLLLGGTHPDNSIYFYNIL